MRRVQLFELEDFAWVPRPIRDGGTDLLDLAFARMDFYSGVIPRLVELLEHTGTTRVVDLCSGGGGGALYAFDAMRARGRELSMVLTDRYPNVAGQERTALRKDAALGYRAESVDAFAVPSDLVGTRTMWSALHHFPPDGVRELIASAVQAGQPLAFFDVAASPGLRRTPAVIAPLAMAINMMVLFVVSLLAVPFLRPLRASRWALTYGIPLIPALVAWDGTVSALRAYLPGELLALAQSVSGSGDYEWSAGTEGRALYLIGRPRAR